MTDLLLQSARLLGSNELSDVRLAGDSIAEITPAGARVEAGVETVDLDGRVLAPGLWDEHLHFTQWTVRRARFDLSGTDSAAAVLDRLRARLVAGFEPGTFVTGYGFRDGTWADAPTLRSLDEVAGAVPVVLISGDLHCAWMSTAAAVRLGARLDDRGVVREGPWIEALAMLEKSTTPTPATFREAAEAAARRGVVGVVEFENTDNIADWPARVAAGVDALRVEASVWPDRLDAAIEAGHRTGDVLDDRGLVRMGRLKVVVDGSLNTRTALCWDPYPGRDPDDPHARGIQSVTPEELRALLRRALPAGILPAVHAIGDRANAQVIDIFEEFGAAGTIEHAQLVSAADFARFGRLRLVASVQPEHAMDDRDVADRHWAGRTDRAFAFGSLHAAGATLRLGSDAPVAPLDPWIGIAAATGRSRDGREPWHPEQRIPLEVALAASMRDRTTVAVGDAADLAILDLDPHAAKPEQLRELPVAGTMLGGRWTWRGL
jgi:predicted amidohydrolase YtcJ